MALDLPGAQAEVGAAEQALDAYNAPGLTQQTQAEVMRGWTPALERSTGETRRMMSEFLPRFSQVPFSGLAAGTTAADFTPQQKLQSQWGELGAMGGELAASSALSEQLGGMASRMQDKAMQALQFGNQQAADKYNRAFQRYQMAWQQAEAEKARRAAARQAAMQAAAMRQSYGDGGYGVDTGDIEGISIDTQSDPKRGLLPNIFQGAQRLYRKGNKASSFLFPLTPMRSGMSETERQRKQNRARAIEAQILGRR